MNIDLTDSTETLSTILEQQIISKNHSWVQWAVDSMIDFRDAYTINKCSNEEESDELLMEYVNHNWDPSGQPHFELTLTRQILLENEEEYYQIRLTLIFEPEKFDGIEQANFWSMDFDSLTDWKNEIEESKGFTMAARVEPVQHQISLEKT